MLVYFPETDSFLLSEESYTRTAFHTELTITVENGKLLFNARQPLYGIMKNIKIDGTVFMRLILTVLAEIVIGLYFMKYSRRSLTVVVLANILTQIFLNLIVWMRYYVLNNSVSTYFPLLIVAEILIFVFEGFIYSRKIPREELQKPYLYALTANAVTFWMSLVAVMR